MTDEEMRQLDAFCAESVLGLTAVKTVMGIEAGTFALVRHGENKGTVFVHECMNNIKPFKPTVNPADAMQVLECCISSDLALIPVEIDRKRHKAGRFRLETIADEGRVVIAIADTLPLAICEFAEQLFSK